MNKSHYYWLDLLRFLAALTVLIVHARAYSFVEYGALTDKNYLIAVFFALTRLGNESVLVFFVLSGFLVGGRVIEKVSMGKFNPISYSLDRSVRIFLPLIPALALTIIIRLIIDGNFDWLVLLGNLFSLQGIACDVFGGNGPLWSLSYEVWFYILALLAASFTISKEFHVGYFLLLAIVAIVFTILHPVYLFCWIIGSLAYIVKPSHFSLKIFLFAILLAIYSVAGTQLGNNSVSISLVNIQPFLPNLDASRLILSVSFALIIQQIIMLKPKTLMTLKLDHLGSVLASFSYTLYLTHYPILDLLSYLGLERAFEININSTLIFIAKIMICIIVSIILYLPFERHTEAIKRKLKDKILTASMPYYSYTENTS